MRRLNAEINTGSMADIAFLLLIFFLVATTIDIDSGLTKKLPPYDDNNKSPEIPGRNVLNIRVNSRDELMINNEVCELKDIRKIAREFLLNPNNEPDKPAKKSKKISHLGVMEVPQGLISLQNSRGTSYNMYIQVLNELTAVGNQIKDELSLLKFEKKYNNLPSRFQKAVSEARPFVISEAEPVFVDH